MDFSRDVELVVNAVRHKLPPVVASQDAAWQRPAAACVLDCVLSLNRDYKRFVVPRVEAFEREFGDVRTVRGLRDVMAAHGGTAAFLKDKLRYNDAARAATIDGVVSMVMSLTSEATPDQELQALRQWARTATPQQGVKCSVPGFKLAGWQYLRMLFGADTAKPDVHIVRFVEKAVGRNVTPLQALDVLHTAAARLMCRVVDLDTTIWEWSANRGADVGDEKGSDVRHLFAWTNFPEMIAVLRQRPKMWMGAKSLLTLQGFINGWHTAEQFHQRGGIISAAFFERFDSWLAGRGVIEPVGMSSMPETSFAAASRGSKTDEAAFELWLGWYDEFLMTL